MTKKSLIDSTQELYSMSEVASILKTNVNYVYKLRDSGLLKCIKIGTYKVRRETLHKFLEDVEGLDITNPNDIKPALPYFT